MNVENISPSSSTHKIGEVGQHDEPSKPSQPPRKTMGVAQNQSKSNSGRKVNYDSKYPEDPPGEEASDNARVWMIYNDEAEAYDEDMLSTFRDSIDALLVFAALFSAVVTSFLLQTSAAMQLDYAKITTYLLAEQILLLRANGNATAINAIPSSPISPDTTNYSGLDIAINVLFLLSLTLSLSNALFCILVKQWLTSYSAKIPGTPRIVALTRNLRFLGVQKWKLPQFIGVLPLMLHASLWMFSGGLLIFVWNLDLALFSATSCCGRRYGDTLLYYSPHPTTFCGLSLILFLSWMPQYALPYLAYWSRSPTPGNGLSIIATEPSPFAHWLVSGFLGLSSLGSVLGVEQPSNVCKTVVWLYDYSSNPTICNAAATSDQSIVDMLAHRGDFILSLWKTASSPDSSAAIPKSSSQLRLAILPSSPTYNSAIRAELALHSWSYYWLREGRLQHRPQAYWMLNDRANALVGFYSQREDWCRPDFIEYVVDCEDVWNPRSNSWDIHSLDWHGGDPWLFTYKRDRSVGTDSVRWTCL
ncbi:hypothetical protein DL96DRAFT_1748598 [Flagelloscypha sp. PMI_526]|nr:hypothetical protein DL96DRAFT_1748598 [Flagelloscypha sp. PMI_526]